MLPKQDDATARSAAAGGPVTRGMLRQRAVELAVSCGRSAETVEKADWEQAKLELTSAQTRGLPPVSGPALERWENEGGVIPECADTTDNLGKHHPHESAR